jgi:diguanylate cyclase (GGDEF)-like protein
MDGRGPCIESKLKARTHERGARHGYPAVSSGRLMDGRLVDALATTVAVAPTVPGACQAAVTAIADQLDGTVACLLAVAGRLRCFGAAGAWQVFDGVPADAGVVGRAFRSGEPALVADVRDDPDYIPLGPGVLTEVCVPVAGPTGAPLGVLNIESAGKLPLDTTRDVLQLTASVLSDRIAALGGIPPQSAGQRLLKHAIALTASPDEAAVLDRTLDAALDITGLSSAAIAMGGGPDTHVAAARGPLAGLLVIADRSPLALLTARARRHGSAYSLGDPAELDARGFERLTRAGIRTMIAVPIGGRTSPPVPLPGSPTGKVGIRPIDGGVLLAVDSSVRRPDADTVGLLELLAAQALVCLERVRLVAQLRERATSDPLTGLGHQGRFTERLGRARPDHTAVLAIDVDQFKAVNDTHGHAEGDRLLVELVGLLSSALRAGDELFRIGGDEFAAVVEVSHEAEALAVAERLVQAARGMGRTISVGAAVRQAGESSETTLRRADEALYAVKRTGRNGARLASPYANGGPTTVLSPSVLHPHGAR